MKMRRNGDVSGGADDGEKKEKVGIRVAGTCGMQDDDRDVGIFDDGEEREAPETVFIVEDDL